MAKYSIHLGKTKVRFNKHTIPAPVTVDGKSIEEIDSYVCLGKMMAKKGDLLSEISRKNHTWEGKESYENSEGDHANRKENLK